MADVENAREDGTFVEAWDSAALSTAVCDELVKQGKIRTTPAFIRGDREAKITKVDNPFFFPVQQEQSVIISPRLSNHATLMEPRWPHSTPGP
jgi:hypothetical protein